jgi:hypothetical protein
MFMHLMNILDLAGFWILKSLAFIGFWMYTNILIFIHIWICKKILAIIGFCKCKLCCCNCHNKSSYYDNINIIDLFSFQQKQQQINWLEHSLKEECKKHLDIQNKYLDIQSQLSLVNNELNMDPRAIQSGKFKFK